MNLKTNGRLDRIVKEIPPAYIVCDAFSDFDKTIITQNTPVILVIKNLTNLLKEKEFKRAVSLGLKAVYSWFKCKHYDDARYFYETLEGCKDLREHISSEVTLRKEWPELVKARGYKNIGIVTQNDSGFAKMSIKQLKNKNELDGITLSLYMANEIEVKDGRFTSNYEIKFRDGDLRKILSGTPFIDYDVRTSRLLIR